MGFEGGKEGGEEGWEGGSGKGRGRGKGGEGGLRWEVYATPSPHHYTPSAHRDQSASGDYSSPYSAAALPISPR